MKLKTHFYASGIIFVMLYFILGLTNALIVFLFHFIPSIDFLMKKLNILARLHRQLFHNIFVGIISSFLLFYFTNPIVGILGAFNFILHIVMDLNGPGVMIFFPFSTYRLKYPQRETNTFSE